MQDLQLILIERNGGENDSRVSVDCPTWTFSAESGLCSCGSHIRGTVKCDPHTYNVSILAGYCMTYDRVHDKIYTARCPYGYNSHLNTETYRRLPQNTSQLNSAMCSPLKRHGRVCGNCEAGYGPAVFSADLNCYHCSGSYHGWGLYFLFELVPATLFFLIIVFFQLRATSAPLNCFLFVSQMIVASYIYYPQPGSYPFGQASNIIITFLLVVYGIWNLDFFRQVMPPFCVSDQITGLHAVAMLYIPVLYLLMLVAFTYALIELHACNFRIVAWLWKSFHKYFVKFRRNVNPRTSIIDAFATLLILSYSRIMFASFSLLHPLTMYAATGKPAEKYAVFYSGNLNYFSMYHIPFAMLAITALVVFNVLPAVFLILYPCKCCQRILGKLGRRSLPLHTFADTFQGCYKRGTNGERDYRYFAALYMVLRASCYITHTVLRPPADWLVPSFLILCASLSFANLRPYRNDVFNKIDSLFLAVTVVLTTSESIVVAVGVAKSRPYQILALLCLFAPLVYVTGYVIAALYCNVRRRRHRQGEEGRSMPEVPYRLLHESAD